MASHNCIIYLKSVISLKNERILSLMDENKILKTGVALENDERGQINPFNIGILFDQ